MRVIAVINQKGGVGKTTTCISLAAELARLKKRVLLIDLDPQGNTTSGLGVQLDEQSVGVDDVLLGDKTIAEASIRIDESKFDLVAADSALAGLDGTGVASKHAMLLNTIKSLDGYDMVLIDCPPSLGLLSINALTAANEVIIPLQAEYYALEGLSQLVGVVDRVKQSTNPSLRVSGLVLTMFDKRTTLANDVAAQLDQHFGELVFETRIPRNVRLAEAPSHGLPIAVFDKWSKGARAYKSLAKEVVARG